MLFGLDCFNWVIYTFFVLHKKSFNFMIFYTVLQFFTPSKLQDEMRREDF